MPTTLLNCAVTGQNLIKFLNDAARSSQMNFFLKQKWDITIRFGMPGDE